MNTQTEMDADSSVRLALMNETFNLYYNAEKPHSIPFPYFSLQCNDNRKGSAYSEFLKVFKGRARLATAKM